MSAPHEPRPDGDPFELLARMADRDDRVLEPGDQPAADALLARLVVSPALVSATQRGHRRRLVVAAAAAAVVVGAGSAIAAVWARQPADAVSLRCYSEASASPAIEVGLVADPALAPSDQCAPAWSDGRIARTGAPELVACVDSLDSTVVVPGRPEACGALGWAPAAEPTADARIDAEVVRAVADALHDCETDPAVAAATVQALFDEFGADTWTVEPPATDGSSCLAPVPDATRRTIELVALPAD